MCSVGSVIQNDDKQHCLWKVRSFCRSWSTSLKRGQVPLGTFQFVEGEASY